MYLSVHLYTRASIFSHTTTEQKPLTHSLLISNNKYHTPGRRTKNIKKTRDWSCAGFRAMREQTDRRVSLLFASFSLFLSWHRGGRQKRIMVSIILLLVQCHAIGFRFTNAPLRQPVLSPFLYLSRSRPNEPTNAVNNKFRAASCCYVR
jgi:hypothetical protein